EKSSQLVFVIINTLYLNKETFLQELVSNASNALINIHYDSMTDPFKLDIVTDLEIDNSSSPQEHMLTLVDTGIGMTKADLINNLGTNVKPGTKNMKTLQAGGE
ncbi:hypothetical protein HispidOSU_025425, partial [Sigmodon hispidus]